MTGLEALNKIDNEVLYGVYAQEHYSNEIETIRKSLKALEIIKEKNVDILDVKLYENYEHYCTAKEDSRLRKDWWLTEEEFNLLKEILGC